MNPDRRIVRIWSRYKRSASPRLRNALMEHYLPFVQKLATRLHARLPSSVQVEDMVSAGVFGLAESIEAYDLDRHIQFTTFSGRRITGSMLDELRATDWVPRQVRTSARQLDAATRQLRAKLGRPSTDEETASHLQMPLSQYTKLKKLVRRTSLLSLNNSPRAVGSSTEIETRQIADPHAADPMHELECRGVKEFITRSLTRSERLIVALYYYEQLTMKEIGIALDLSESRVSQLHTTILTRLKKTAQNLAA